MPAPKDITRLVEQFDRNAEAYRSPGYNETQVRREFIDPFFKCLGWDIDNTSGFAEAYKDVIHEDAIKIGGATKAPDYCFRVGGTRKFFLEAKKPAVNIKQDSEPAYQLRRYAWSAGLPLSVLTDFEEFAVYDCRVRPALADKASAGRTQYLTYRDYSDRWDEIAGVFSRDALYKGSFDKYAESNKIKRGTATVDAAFLEEIENWRELLARNFALRNPRLEQRELNYAVQVTIDRLLFLRMCEDRGIEQYGQLLGFGNGEKIYQRLFQLFRAADDRYNSGLFYFHTEPGRAEPPDELTPALKLDDKPLKDILRTLYYPESPYEFSVLPAEILGQVYEQFLGKVIRLTEGHQAKIEEKPEVRKAGGVYYTPTYIVDYIVKNTVGKLLGNPSASSAPLRANEGESRAEAQSTQSLTPRQAAKLRILDPACGSGSFLLGAYQYLLDWHRDWYVADGPDKHTKEIYQGPGGAWRLTTAEKRRILLNNIYGVDIDPQAVETTKLSLLLKVLEGESKQSLEKQLLLFHERALPDLASNIKCGNSLIGPDFYENQQGTLFDDDERYRINVFDWNAEFPAIMKAGGFDAVIGNPPYIRVSNVDENIRPYLYRRYQLNHRFDMYVAFVARGFGLLSPAGRFGFIVPNKFFTSDYGKGIRALLAQAKAVSSILDFGDKQVFDNATTYTCLLFLSRAPAERLQYTLAQPQRGGGFACESEFQVSAATLSAAPWVFASESAVRILDRLKSLPKLGELCEIKHGLQTGCDSVFLLEEQGARGSAQRLTVVSESESTPFEIETGAVRKVVKGLVDQKRYQIVNDQRYVVFPYTFENGTATLLGPSAFRSSFPLAWAYLNRHSKELKAKVKPGDWYGFRRRNYDLRDHVARLLVPSIALRGSFFLDPAGEYHFVGSGGGGGGGYGLFPRARVKESPHYLLGILNSRLLDWVIKQCNSRFGHGYYSFNRQYIEPLPICPIDFSEASNRTRHDRMAALVTEMLALHEKLAAPKTAHAKTALERQIAATDRQIDRLVYDLYGLTEAEIKIVEAATAAG